MAVANHQRGFTLLELLVSLSLTAVVLTLLLSGIRVTQAAWQRGSERLVILDRTLAQEEAIASQMSSAISRQLSVQYDQQPWQLICFRGDSQELRFLSSYSFLGQRHSGLWLVNYRVTSEPSGKQQLVISERVFSDESQLASYFLAPPSALSGLRFIENADRIELSYLSPTSPGAPAAWLPEWKCDHRKQLPRAVRIRWRGATEDRELTLLIPVWEELS